MSTWEPYQPVPTEDRTTPREPPAAPAMRAADRDRDHVATLLSHAYAEGRITHDEHDERLGLAMVAKTFDDLIPLTEDLVPLDRPLPTADPAGPTTDNLPTVDQTGAEQDTDSLVAILGEARRDQTHRVRRHIAVRIVLGEAKLDLREAVFDHTEIDLGGVVFLGEIKIIVGEGVDVRDQTSNILAETKIKGLDPRPGGPVITLRGTVVLGEVNVRGPLAKPFWKALTGR